MKKTIKGVIAAGIVASALFTVQGARALPQGPPPPGYGPDYGHEAWAVPPAELRGVEAQGFHEGVEGARKDYENHRQPNVENRDEYRHPSVHGPDKAAYRQGFRRGYQTGVAHLMHNGPWR